MNLKHKDTWTFTYRGIMAEIVHWGKDPEHNPAGNWNYYLWIPLKVIADEELRKKMVPVIKKYDTFSIWDDNIPLIHHLEFHVGVTYLEYFKNPIGDEFIKPGCDYNHYYDEGKKDFYNEKCLTYDAKNSIDKLHELTTILVRDNWYGKLYKESEGQYDNEDKSYFTSFETIEKKKADKLARESAEQILK